MRERKNTKSVRLPVNAGPKPDTFAEEVEVLDSNNVVLLPDGSGVKPREGFEIRRNDGIGYGSERKILYCISNPPDIDYGDMLIMVNSSNGRNFNEITEVVRTTHTVATENPMPMPELPPEPPVAMVAPVAAATQIAGTYTAMFFDGTDIVGPATLTPCGHSRFAYIFRTENYLVAIDARDNVNGYVEVWSWALATLTANPTGTHAPDWTSVVYTDVGDVTPYKPVYAYQGDVVYMMDDVGEDAHTDTAPYTTGHDYRLFKIDLAGEAVTSTSITGLPDELYGFGNREEDCDPVDKDGNLWTVGYGESSARVWLKINPATSAVVASRVVASGTAPYSPNYSMGALPDGSMIFNTLSDGWQTMSSDLQTITAATNTDSVNFYNFLSTIRNSVTSTGRAIAYKSGDYMLADVMTGTIQGTAVESSYAMSYGSIFGGTHIYQLQREYDEGLEDYVVRLRSWNITTGDTAIVATGDIFLYDDGYFGLVDCYGWGLENIQGAAE